MSKTKKAKGKGGALVVLVVDKSGSMEPIRQATIEGCNRFIDETKQADSTARISLVLFDVGVSRPFTASPVMDIEPIDGNIYRPGGGTALLDAMGRAMVDIEAMPERPSKVVIACLTDGQENSSHEFTRAAVKAAVERHEKEDGWQILYLGANVDSFAEAGALGVARSNATLDWAPTAAGASAAMASASTSNFMYLRGGTATAAVASADYTSNLSEDASSTAVPDLQTRLARYKATRTTPPESKTPPKP